MCELRHMPRFGLRLYDPHLLHEEAIMRRLIESLCPENGQIYWKLVGGVFAFYVVMMAAGTGVFVAHQSAKSSTDAPAVASAARGKQRPVAAAPGLLTSLAFAIGGQGN
jgi:hypothetical protein